MEARAEAKEKEIAKVKDVFDCSFWVSVLVGGFIIAWLIPTRSPHPQIPQKIIIECNHKCSCEVEKRDG